MRLYALLFTLFVIGARAATIPEAEKKLPVIISEQTENTSSEQELLDQTNNIKDVENNLRVKPTEDIPVAVIIENKPSLKITEEDDDVRPEPDLNNPGLPQRQLHETQNPEYHETEQQAAITFKQSINDAQIILRQGFQGVSEGFQHFYGSNAQLKNVQQTIQSLRDGFTSQINKLNETIHHVLNPENPNNAQSADEASKANFKNIETGLSSLKNDFTRGVNTLAEGVNVVASLKDDAENPDTGSTIAPVTTNLFVEQIQVLHAAIVNGFNNLTQAIFNQGQGSQPANGVANSNVQSDTPASPATPLNPFQTIGNSIAGFLNLNQQNPATVLPTIQNPINNFFTQNPTIQAQGSTASPVGPFVQAFQNNLNSNPFINNILNFIQPNRPGAQTPATSPVAPTKTDTVTQAGSATTVAPARNVADAETQRDTNIAEVETIKEAVKELEGELKGKPGSGNSDKPGLEVVEAISEIVETPKEIQPEKPINEVKEENAE